MTLPHASRMRYRSLAWVVSACFLAVFLRLVWLHWVDAPELRAEAMQARRVRQELPCRRGEIRDAIELEMRRSNLVPKEFVGGNTEAATPLLTIEVKFERGLGRYEAVINLTIRDNATITRNREPVLAVTYAQTKKAVGSSDGTLVREIKGRSRELVIELIEGLKKSKGK